MRVLMVCLGNICRSPMAEGLLRHKAEAAGLPWVVESAGTESYHIGEAPHKLSIKVCKEHGVGIGNQRARKFTAEHLAQYDKIYAMADDVYKEMKQIAGKDADMGNVDLFLNELKPGTNLSVPDPWYGGEEDFKRAYKLIDATCDAIIEKYK